MSKNATVSCRCGHDDIVDALGLVGQLMDKWSAGIQRVDNVVRFCTPRDFKDYVIHDELEPGDGGSSVKLL